MRVLTTGTTSYSHMIEDDTTWGVQIISSGTNILVQAKTGTGGTFDTVEWQTTVEKHIVKV